MYMQYILCKLQLYWYKKNIDLWAMKWRISFFWSFYCKNTYCINLKIEICQYGCAPFQEYNYAFTILYIYSLGLNSGTLVLKPSWNLIWNATSESIWTYYVWDLKLLFEIITYLFKMESTERKEKHVPPEKVASSLLLLFWLKNITSCQNKDAPI